MLLRYILKRILIMIPTLIVTSALIFTVINLPEGDYFETLAAEMQAQGEKADMSRIEFLKKDFPNNHGEIKHALADGDLVALHIHNQRSPELRGNAVVDLFRIENGKVVEHWDVVQAIPDPQKAKNSNTMF